MSKRVVALGDSNTRFWLGDGGGPGALRDAWPAQLEGLLNAAGVPSKVQNEGQPGAGVQMAAVDFGFFTRGADLCILGLGTNDLLGGGLLEPYLEHMGSVLDQAAEAGISMIVLGLPWFDSKAGQPGAEEAVVQWNESLEALCTSRGVSFVDLYTPTAQEPELWFNEVVSPKMHLSIVGQHEVAELLCPIAVKLLQKNSDETAAPVG